MTLIILVLLGKEGPREELIQIQISNEEARVHRPYHTIEGRDSLTEASEADEAVGMHLQLFRRENH